jgi:hypothetical protein
MTNTRRISFCMISALLCASSLRIALAQDGEEIILDPELGDLPPPPPPAPVSAEPNGEVRVLIRSRVGVDLVRDDPREDVWELTQLALFEAKVRRSERLRFAVGVRVRHLFATREEDTSDANAERYALDATPTAAYGDATVADGLHLRVGYQGVHLGQFDLLAFTDVLSVYDFRSGPTMPEEGFEIAQPALRVDWDLSASVAFTAIYVPFFQAHRWSVLDGDYAFFPNSPPYNPESGLTEDVEAQEMLRRTLSRSVQANLSDGAFATFTPDMNFKQPQAAAHLTVHGAAGELGFTVAIARDQTPAFRPPELRLGYEPYQMLAVDGMTDIGSVQVGAEFAYMFGRTLLTTVPGPIPPSGESDVAHAAVRLNYARGEDFVLLIEGTASRAQSDAPTASGVPDARWLWLFGEHWFFSVAAYATLSLGEARLQLGATILNGPSYLLSPQAEIELLDGFFVEVGAYVVGDIRPPASLGLVPGGMYDHVDQVFIGLRWVP